MTRLIPLVFLFVLLPTMLFAADATSPPTAVAELTIQPQPGKSKWFSNAEPLFGQYLATGDGVATGPLSGRVNWDFYEDQSRADTHPAYLRGFIERDGTRHRFEMIGVYTPGPGEQPEYWTLSGTIVLESDQLMGTRQLLVTGKFMPRLSQAHWTVWRPSRPAHG